LVKLTARSSSPVSAGKTVSSKSIPNNGRPASMRRALKAAHPIGRSIGLVTVWGLVASAGPNRDISSIHATCAFSVGMIR